MPCTSTKPLLPLPRSTHHDLMPKDPTGRRLFSIFEYYWNPIKASMPSDATQKPEWITLKQRKLSPRILWRDWQDAATLIGVRFGKTTTYGLLDIDKNSPYLNPTSLSHIRQTLETIGICRSLLIRSSWNGGVHLYLPLPKEVSSWSLQLALHHALTVQGFQVKAGHLEIFPNAKAFNAQYNGHRLPLQPASGSCLLDEALCPIDYSLERFLDGWEVAAVAQDRELLDEALWSARTHTKKRTSQSQKAVDAWKRDLETDIEAGWTDFGQTNRLLKRIAEYGVVFEGLSGSALAEYIERIAVSRPGFEEWCSHQTDIRQRSQSWAKAAENYYWQLGTERDRTGNLYTQFTRNRTNEKRAVEAQTRIYEAVQELDLKPFGITQRATQIMERVGCSKETLYKYKNLWHPDYVCLLDQQPVHPTEIGNSGHFEAENQNFLQSPKPAPEEEVRATPILVAIYKERSPSQKTAKNLQSLAIDRKLVQDFFEKNKLWEKIAYAIWFDLIAWAIEDVKADMGADVFNSLKQEEFQIEVNRYLFEKESFFISNRIHFLEKSYSERISALIVDALDPPNYPLSGLENLLGIHATPEKKIVPSTEISLSKIDSVAAIPTGLPIVSSISAQLNTALWKPDDTGIAYFRYHSKSNQTNYLEHLQALEISRLCLGRPQSKLLINLALIQSSYNLFLPLMRCGKQFLGNQLSHLKQQIL